MVEQSAIEIPDFQIEEEETGTVYVKLMDCMEVAPIANTPYTILDVDGEELSGTTDSDGVLRHEDVPMGYYILSANDEETTVFTDIEPEEPAIARLLFTEPSDMDEEDDMDDYIDDSQDYMDKTNDEKIEPIERE